MDHMDHMDRGAIVADETKVPAVLQGAFFVLQAVGEAGPAGANVAEVQMRTGLGQRTTYRHLASLKALGMVTEASERSRYRLGPVIAGLAQNTSDQREFLRRARMFCEELAERSGEPVHVTVCDQGTAVTVATASRSSPVSEKSPPIVPGSRRPLHASASGKVFIAYNRSTLEAYSVRPLERFTQYTITDLRELERECLRVRQQGFAEDHQEYSLGITCVAVPVVGAGGRAVGALTVSTKRPVMSEARRAELLRALRPAAKEFSAAIGGEGGA